MIEIIISIGIVICLISIFFGICSVKSKQKIQGFILISVGIGIVLGLSILGIYRNNHEILHSNVKGYAIAVSIVSTIIVFAILKGMDKIRNRKSEVSK